MRVRMSLGVVALLAAATGVSAAPINLTAAQWTAGVAGLTVTTEDFEGITPGPYASPLVLSNSTATTTEGSLDPWRVFDNTALFCDDLDTCMTANALTDTRTFSGFAAGTTHFAVLQFFGITSLDVFEVTVAGGSGTAVFNLAPSASFAFADPSGLISVAFRNLGSPGGGVSNYSFDNVATARPTAGPVPEPASMLLFGTGVAGLAARARRRRSATR